MRRSAGVPLVDLRREEAPEATVVRSGLELRGAERRTPDASKSARQQIESIMHDLAFDR
jgi:hypothetical protein